MNTKIKLTGLAVWMAGCVAMAGPVHAFDTEPHVDMTRDALTAEGFGNTALQIVQVNNWLVDMGEQSRNQLEFSNSAWNSAVLIAADRSHFDSTDAQGNSGAGYKTTAELTAEWDRLRSRVFTLARAARDSNNPLRLLTLLGISLHQVQDFYTHTNWVERTSANNGGIAGSDGPGWQQKHWGSSPTWFDVSSAARNRENLYGHSNSNGPHRKHGSWNANENGSVVEGMSKDWAGRPYYKEAYTAAYFATRQWVRAVRSWVANETFWNLAMSYANRFGGELDHDQEMMLKISVASGHWNGEGDAVGDAPGDGGRLLDLLPVISDFVIHGPTPYQIDWANTITQTVAPVTSVSVPIGVAATQGISIFGGSSLPAVASSMPLQASYRLVRVQATTIQEIDDMDLGTIDEADYFVKANIAGQEFRSGNIYGHDNYYFTLPNSPFTFLKAVPTNATFAEPLHSLHVEVATSTDSWSGTDDDVYLRINDQTRFKLDKPLYDDFENGDRDVYSLPVDGPRYNIGDIKYLQIEKSSDGIAGGWKLRGVKLWANGTLWYTNDSINKWLEDDDRTWRAPNFTIAPWSTTAVPTWISLYDEDSYFNDHADIHPDHDRNNLGLSYDPVSGAYRGNASGMVSGASAGGDTYGGRLDSLTGDGPRARLYFRFLTINPELAAAGNVPDSSGPLGGGVLTGGTLTGGTLTGGTLTGGLLMAR